MSDNHDLLNDNDMCSFSGYEADDEIGRAHV